VVVNPKSETRNQKSLRPPQFGLRSMLIAVTACGVLFALLRWLDPIAVAGIAFLAVSVFFHVAGNAIGTRLREIGDEPGPAEGEQTRIGIRCPRPQDFAPATQLGQRRSLGWTIIVAISVGVASGAVGGGLWTFLASRGHAALLSIAVGVLAFAILGGIAAFAVVAFVQVLSGAIWQALSPTREPLTDEPRHG
jgi:hypothetical protein